MKGSKAIGMLSLMMLLLICASLPAEICAEQGSIRRGMEITTQLLGGYLADGIVLAVSYASFTLVWSGGEFGEAVSLWLIIMMGASPGIILASSGSVYGIGQAWGHRNGSFGKTLLGASIPPLLVASLGAAVGAAYGEYATSVSAAIAGAVIGAFGGSFLSPVGAVAGYHLFAQPQKPAVMPLEELRSSYSDNGGRTFVVPLLQIRF